MWRASWVREQMRWSGGPDEALRRLTFPLAAIESLPPQLTPSPQCMGKDIL